MSGVDLALSHIVGDTITYGTLRRSRCAWCGALIEEVDLAKVECERTVDGEDIVPRFHGWVEVNELFTKQVAVESNTPPKNSCMCIDPFVTR